MTDEQINAAIREMMPVNDTWRDEDFCSNLNAMHEAEKVLNAGKINTYLGHLYRFNKTAHAGANPWEIIAVRVAVHATARQRAEAFLRTIGKWEEV